MTANRIKTFLSVACLWLMGIFMATGIWPMSLLAKEATAKSLVGNWEGTIETANLKVLFHIKENPDHSLSATLDSLDQNTYGLPVSQVSYEKGHLHLNVSVVHGSYDGQMDSKGSEILGKWSQGQALTLNLKKIIGSSKPGPIAIKALDNGLPKITNEMGDVALITATVFTEGWQFHPFSGESDDSHFDSFMVLPNGGRIGLKSKLINLKSGLHVRVVMTALDPVKVISARLTIQLAYSNWIGVPYQFGKAQGTILQEKPPSNTLVTGDQEKISIGPNPNNSGLSINVATRKLTTSLQDSRQWGDTLEVILTHGETVDKPWDWKAGEEKTFDFTVSFNRKIVSKPDKIAAIEPHKPFPYIVEKVSFENPKAGAKLAGTLTLPKGEGPFPAVLLIVGSGQVDRNETVSGHRPFLVISDYLTRKGFAVLRYDKRGIGNSTGDYKSATTQDFAGDALCGVGYLKSRKEINSKIIGLIGHSEGGLIAPMVAVQSKDVAFIVLMAGPGIDGEKISLSQAKRIQAAEGVSAKLTKVTQSISSRVLTVVKSEENKTKVKSEIQKIVQEESSGLTKEEKDLLETTVQNEENLLLSPWMHFFLNYDPKYTLKKVACPVLAMNGELDIQVPAKEDLSAIETSLKEGQNPDYTVKEFPKMNHLFQDCKTGGLSEYTDATLAPARSMLDFMASWIEKHIK